jgi:hypothetical protein
VSGFAEGAVIWAASEEYNMDTTTLFIIIVVVLFLIVGGWYGRGRWR